MIVRPTVADSPPGGFDRLGEFATLEEALNWCDEAGETAIVHTNARCPVCGGPLLAAGGPGAGDVARSLAEAYDGAGEPDTEWLSGKGRAFVYCDIEPCDVHCHVSHADGVEGVRQ